MNHLPLNGLLFSHLQQVYGTSVATLPCAFLSLLSIGKNITITAWLMRVGFNLKEILRNCEIRVNCRTLGLNDKRHNSYGTLPLLFIPYISSAGGVSHWDRCLSLFTRSLRPFFAPAGLFPSYSLTSKNNDK